MLELSPTSLAAVVLVSGLAGVFKVAFGIGAGVFLTPILALVLPPKVAVALMAPLMLVTDLSALHHHWRKWHVRHVLTLLPACFAGVVAGSLFLGWAPPETVRRAIGAIALLFVAMQLLSFAGRATRISSPLPTWCGWIIGLAGGITTAIAHSGGIVLSIYLLSVGLTKGNFIASLVAIFFASNLLKFPLYSQIGILTPPIVLTGLALTPVMLLGGRLGLSLNRRMSAAQFNKVLTVIVAASGAMLLATP